MLCPSNVKLTVPPGNMVGVGHLWADTVVQLMLIMDTATMNLSEIFDTNVVFIVSGLHN